MTFSFVTASSSFSMDVEKIIAGLRNVVSRMQPASGEPPRTEESQGHE
jgi:hypothetical protein